MYKLCRHIRTSGGRCRSAALANENYCYYHLTQRRLSITLDLPPLEDRHSIQVAVSRVLTALAAGLLDRRDAGMYLYGIQIASSNLAPEHGCLTPCDPVRRAVLTQQGDEVAEAKTIFEEQDLSGHKKDCDCADCIHTETDDPHHPDCRCGECHCFTDEEEPIAESAPLTIHGAADISRQHSKPKAKNPCHTRNATNISSFQPGVLNPLRNEKKLSSQGATLRRTEECGLVAAIGGADSWQ